MDVGHGQGSFIWTVAERCADSGFLPDIISSDLHIGAPALLSRLPPACYLPAPACPAPLGPRNCFYFLASLSVAVDHQSFLTACIVYGTFQVSRVVAKSIDRTKQS